MNVQSGRRAGRGRTWPGIVALAGAVLALAPCSWAQHAGGGDATPLPAVGEVIAPFDAQGVDGSMKKVGFEDKGSTVLLFFLSGCPTCHRMIPEWNRAFQRKPQGLHVLGVLMDREPAGFFQTTPISFPVVRSPGREFLLKLKVSRAPLMVRVGRGGRIEDVALGYQDPIRVGEVFRP